MIAKQKTNVERTVAYIRASSDQQMAASPARQKADCRTIAKRFDLKPIEDDGFYAESRGRSGLRMDNRDALAQLIVDAENGLFDVVVIAETSRLSREEVLDQAALWKRIRDSGARLFTNIGEVQFNDLGSLIQMVVNAQHAHDESKNIAMRCTSGKRAKWGLNGDRKPEYILPGQITFGYMKVYKLGEKIVHIRRYDDPARAYLKPRGVVCELQPTDRLEELDTARDVFQLLADGGNSRQAAKLMNSRGFLTARGNQWIGQDVRNMIRRRQYIGDVMLGDTPLGRFASIAKEPIIISGICPAIIDKATWEAANHTMDVLGKYAGRRGRDPRRLLSGLVFSPEGSPLYVANCQGGRSYSNGVGTRSQRKGRKPGEKSVSIRCHLLDNAVLNYLRSIITEPGTVDAIRQQLTEQIRLTDAVADPTAEELAALRAEIERAAKRVVEVEDDGIVAMVNQKIRELRKREKALVDRQRRTIEKTEQTKRVQDALDAIPKMLEKPTPKLGLILSNWIERVVVYSTRYKAWNAEIHFMDGGRVLLEDRDINRHIECHRVADWLEEHGEARAKDIAEALGIHSRMVSVHIGRAIKRGRPIKRKSYGVYEYTSSVQWEKEVLNLVTTESQHIDQILRHSTLDPSRVLSTLTVLEMKRFIRRLPGGYLVRSVN